MIDDHRTGAADTTTPVRATPDPASISANGAHGRRLRFAVIGYGYWGPQLVRNLDRLPTGQVAYIVDLSEDRRKAAQRDYPNIAVIAAMEDALGTDVDAVVVATPIRTHFALARMALERGKHVFVEKPLTANVAQAKTLSALATRNGRVLMVGHTFMYNPAVEELRRLVQSGALGRVYYADSTRANLGIFQNDINVIWDLAPHDLSILSYVLGVSPRRVSAHGGSYVRPDVVDVAHIVLRYPDDMMAHIHVSWLSPSKVRRFTIVGDKQMVVYDDVDSNEKIRVFNRGVDAPDHTVTFGEFQLSYRYGDIVSPYISGSEPLAVETRHFAEAIIEGNTPRSDARDGLRVVRILEAADTSMARDGAFIEIEQDEQDQE
ncbi:MAG TPA: Gfo/Idh/MocA family oxidoreductase [Ktedonobacterales bacterium]|nr:Gfo/Idh/MocA family oxidoreductase [Ktedonobacterales bacterium]